MPELDGMYFVALASRLAHIIAAVILVGGLIYLRMMVVPPREAEASTAGDSAEQYFLGHRGRWARTVMLCAAFLIASGLYNYIAKVRAFEMAGNYHMFFGIKFLLGLFVIFVASIVAGRTEAAQRTRGRVRLWLNAAIVCSILVIILASTMRTFDQPPKVSQHHGPGKALVRDVA